MKMGAQGSAGERRACCSALWPNTAALGKTPATRGHPCIHAACMLCSGRPSKNRRIQLSVFAIRPDSVFCSEEISKSVDC